MSDIVIETNSLDGRPERPRACSSWLAKSAGDKIAGMTATVEVWGLVTFNFAGQCTTRPITLIGIQPDEKATVGPFRSIPRELPPVMEGKKDRSATAPRQPTSGPAGNLTSEAAAWRNEIKQRRKWIEERLDAPRESPSEGAEHGSHLANVGHSQPAGQTAPAGNGVAQAGPHVSTPNTHAPNDAAPSSAATPKPLPDAQASRNPFEDTATPVPVPPPTQQARQRRRARRLPACYIGAGLFRFPYEDAKTGEPDDGNGSSGRGRDDQHGDGRRRAVRRSADFARPPSSTSSSAG